MPAATPGRAPPASSSCWASRIARCGTPRWSSRDAPSYGGVCACVSPGPTSCRRPSTPCTPRLPAPKPPTGGGYSPSTTSWLHSPRRRCSPSIALSPSPRSQVRRRLWPRWNASTSTVTTCSTRPAPTCSNVSAGPRRQPPPTLPRWRSRTTRPSAPCSSAGCTPSAPPPTWGSRSAVRRRELGQPPHRCPDRLTLAVEALGLRRGDLDVHRDLRATPVDGLQAPLETQVEDQAGDRHPLLLSCGVEHLGHREVRIALRVHRVLALTLDVHCAHAGPPVRKAGRIVEQLPDLLGLGRRGRAVTKRWHWTLLSPSTSRYPRARHAHARAPAPARPTRRPVGRGRPVPRSCSRPAGCARAAAPSPRSPPASAAAPAAALRARARSGPGPARAAVRARPGNRSRGPARAPLP